MIVVNGRFLTQKITGVQRFALEITKQLKKYYGSSLCVVTPHNIILTEDAKILEVKVIGKRCGYYWEQIELPIWLRSHGKPTILNLGNMAPIFYKNKCVVIHDITFKRYPNTFSWKFRCLYNIMIPMIIKHSKHIFTVSDFSMKEISNFYGIPKDKMTVVFNAVDEKFHKFEDPIFSKKDYLLAVSSVKENKNFMMVLNAFEKAIAVKTSLYLYVVGDVYGGSFKKMNLEKYKKNSNIYFLGRISDEKLIKLYSNAKAFIFPSFYEGFGIPVLEAQACGCPVISSNSASMPEVLGDSALLVSPDNLDGFVSAIFKVMNEDIANELIMKGTVNVNRFSWQKNAQVIIDYIECKIR